MPLEGDGPQLSLPHLGPPQTLLACKIESQHMSSTVQSTWQEDWDM